MKYKTEMHAHTSNVSRCSGVSADELAAEYKNAGYRTLVVTDHFNPDTFHHLTFKDWKEQVEYFISGYNRVKQYEDLGFSVILGMEVRFYENNNDYLVYGVTKDFLLECEDIMNFGIHKFIEKSRAAGLITVQAHPFRNGMTITPPDFIDGIEISNRHPYQQSRNEIAGHWAQLYPDLIKTGGTDYHQLDYPKAGGILTDAPVNDSHELLKVLKSGSYEIL